MAIYYGFSDGDKASMWGLVDVFRIVGCSVFLDIFKIVRVAVVERMEI